MYFLSPSSTRLALGPGSAVLILGPTARVLVVMGFSGDSQLSAVSFQLSVVGYSILTLKAELKNERALTCDRDPQDAGSFAGVRELVGTEEVGTRKRGQHSQMPAR